VTGFWTAWGTLFGPITMWLKPDLSHHRPKADIGLCAAVSSIDGQDVEGCWKQGTDENGPIGHGGPIRRIPIVRGGCRQPQADRRP